MSTVHLDTRGLICPLPVIRTQDRMRTLRIGQTLVVRCTDPGAAHDIPAWCRVHGHEVLEVSDGNSELRIRLRKAH